MSGCTKPRSLRSQLGSAHGDLNTAARKLVRWTGGRATAEKLAREVAEAKERIAELKQEIATHSCDEHQPIAEAS